MLYIKKQQFLFIFIILLITFISCSDLKKSNKSSTSSQQTGLPQGITLGASSDIEVVDKLGEPAHEYKASDEENAQIYQYKELGAMKFEDGKMKAFFRQPKDQESKLQYWLQLWANKKTETEKMENSVGADGAIQYQMSCPEDNTTIIYDEVSGSVKRVVFYEK